MPAQLHRLEGAHKELKAAGCCVPGLEYALFVLLCTLFFLADQDCSRCKYVLCTANLCTLILCVTMSLWNIREAATAVGSAKTVLLLWYFCALYHYYCNYFFNYMHYIKSLFGLEFIASADYRPIASSNTGNVVRSIQQWHRPNLGQLSE